jgi:NAD(P)-dependent dehydrogenase (short-subunit alcohol dehydrogenase family)
VSPQLEDKVCVVMGGTSGIGLSAARAMIQAGAKVVLVGRDQSKARDAQERLGPAALALAGDASRPQTAPRALAAALKRFGRFDGLYHVAGGSGRRQGDGPLHELTDRGWSYTLRLNLDSLFYSNRAAVIQFRKQRSPGSVLNMTSVLGYSPAPKYFGTHAYAASKAAIIGLTRAAASFYAAEGIRFNAIAPGLVETPMSTRARQDPAIMKFISSKQPLDGGRIGSAADLDAAAIFFLSDASRFVTGQVLAVDGGWGVSDGQH